MAEEREEAVKVGEEVKGNMREKKGRGEQWRMRRRVRRVRRREETSFMNGDKAPQHTHFSTVTQRRRSKTDIDRREI